MIEHKPNKQVSADPVDLSLLGVLAVYPDIKIDSPLIEEALACFNRRIDFELRKLRRDFKSFIKDLRNEMSQDQFVSFEDYCSDSRFSNKCAVRETRLLSPQRLFKLRGTYGAEDILNAYKQCERVLDNFNEEPESSVLYWLTAIQFLKEVRKEVAKLTHSLSLGQITAILMKEIKGRGMVSEYPDKLEQLAEERGIATDSDLGVSILGGNTVDLLKFCWTADLATQVAKLFYHACVESSGSEEDRDLVKNEIRQQATVWLEENPQDHLNVAAENYMKKAADYLRLKRSHARSAKQTSFDLIEIQAARDEALKASAAIVLDLDADKLTTDENPWFAGGLSKLDRESGIEVRIKFHLKVGEIFRETGVEVPPREKHMFNNAKSFWS